MSALARAIQRSFAADEHRDPVVSAHHRLNRRRLGPAAIYAQALATVAPAAAMVLFPVMLVRTGQAPTALALAVVAMLGMCCLGGALALLTARISASGGIYSFATMALGPTPGLVVAGCLSVKYVGSAALSVHHLARSLDLVADSLGLAVDPTAVMVGAVIGVTTLIMITVRSGIRRAAAALMLIEVASLVFLVTTMALAPDGVGTGPLTPPGGHLTYLVVTFVVFAMAGFESATFLGPESRRGLAAVTRVTWTTPVLCTLLLVGAGVATLDGRADVIINAYLHDTSAGAPAAVAIAVHLALAMSMLGSATASVNAVSRAWYALGLEGVISARWAAVHPRLRTPHRTVAVAAGLVTATAAVLVVAAPSTPELITGLRGAVRIALLIMYAVAVIAAAVLLRRLDEHTAGSVVLVVAAAVLSLGMMVAVLLGEFAQRPAATVAVVLVLVVLGPATVWFGGRRRRRSPGVYDRSESRDALPGSAGVGRDLHGEPVLTGQARGTVADDRDPVSRS